MASKTDARYYPVAHCSSRTLSNYPPSNLLLHTHQARLGSKAAPVGARSAQNFDSLSLSSGYAWTIFYSRDPRAVSASPPAPTNGFISHTQVASPPRGARWSTPGLLRDRELRSGREAPVAGEAAEVDVKGRDQHNAFDRNDEVHRAAFGTSGALDVFRRQLGHARWQKMASERTFATFRTRERSTKSCREEPIAGVLSWLIRGAKRNYQAHVILAACRRATTGAKLLIRGTAPKGQR